MLLLFLGFIDDKIKNFCFLRIHLATSKELLEECSHVVSPFSPSLVLASVALEFVSGQFLTYCFSS